MNDLVYLILALGFTKEQREYLLQDIDLTKPDSMEALKTKIKEYIDENLISNNFNINREQVNNAVKNVLSNI